MRTPLKSIAKAALTRPLPILFILLIGAIGVQTITSCSSGDEPRDNNGSSPSNGNNSSSSGASNGNGGGANLSDLPKQVYLVDFDDKGDNIVKKEIYGGSSDITLRIPKYVGMSCDGDGSTMSCHCTGYDGVKYKCEEDEYHNSYENKPAGKIQNGQVSLNLPAIDSKYLQDFQSFWSCKDDEMGRECEAFYPENLAMFATEWFAVNISGKACYLVLSSSGEEETRGALFYSSKAGEITGRFCTGSSDGVCMQYRNFDDLNFSKGWNVVYYLSSGKYSNSTYTSNLSKTGGTLEWWIGGCEGL